MYNHKKMSQNDTTFTPLYNAIRKYSWQALKFEHLLRCSSEDVDELERLYITRFKSLNIKYGYNLDSGGVLNKKHSSKTCQKISTANKNKSSVIFKTRIKKIQASDVSGNLVGIYESASEAARLFDVSPNTISRAARGGRKSSCGLIWNYIN